MENSVLGVSAPIQFGLQGLDEIWQNVRIILTSMAWSVPLDRDFAFVPDMIDRPIDAVARRDMAAIVEAIETHEPRVRVTRIRYVQDVQQTMDGSLVPLVDLKIRDEYLPALTGVAA